MFTWVAQETPQRGLFRKHYRIEVSDQLLKLESAVDKALRHPSLFLSAPLRS